MTPRCRAQNINPVSANWSRHVAFFLIAFTMLAALVKPAAGAEVPRNIRAMVSVLGTDGTRYYRCRHATGEDYLEIRRDRINLTEESDCRINAVTPIAKGHRLRVCCPDAPELVGVNLRLDARGRLRRD